jgi:hypothetical protein
MFRWPYSLPPSKKDASFPAGFGWESALPYDAETYITDVRGFESYMAVFGRRGGFSKAWCANELEDDHRQYRLARLSLRPPAPVRVKKQKGAIARWSMSVVVYVRVCV